MDNRKRIPVKDVRQIAYEVALWAQDHQELENMKRLLKKKAGEPFKQKFDKWIDDRIKMVLDRNDV